MEDSKRFKALKSLSCISKKSHIVLLIRGTPYAIFVWRGKVYWDNINTGETLSFEEAFDKLPDDVKVEIIFNIDLFR